MFHVKICVNYLFIFSISTLLFSSMCFLVVIMLSSFYTFNFLNLFLLFVLVFALSGLGIWCFDCFGGGLVRPPNECPRYDTKRTDGKVPVMLKLWGMWSTPSLPSLPGPLRPGVVTPDRVLSMGQIELNCILMRNWITWNRTVLIFELRTELFELELFD